MVKEMMKCHGEEEVLVAAKVQNKEKYISFLLIRD